MGDQGLSVRASAVRSLLMLTAATACFALLDTTTKWVTTEVPLCLALWALYAIQSAIYTGVVLATSRRQRLRTAHRGAQWLRGVLLAAVQILAFLSLKYLPVGEFTAIAMTTPLLVTLLAGRLLGDHVSLMRFGLVLGGFAGTLIIARPGSSSIGWALLLPMGLVMVNTAYQLLTSWMSRTQDTVSTLFYTSVVGLLLSSLMLPYAWSPVTSAHAVFGLLLMGLAATVGNLLFVKAFERTSAASLMPYTYLQIGFGILGGWLVFSHVPDGFALLGMALIAVCGVAGGVLSMVEGRRKA